LSRVAAFDYEAEGYLPRVIDLKGWPLGASIMSAMDIEVLPAAKAERPMSVCESDPWLPTIDDWQALKPRPMALVYYWPVSATRFAKFFYRDGWHQPAGRSSVPVDEP
jgi:hypothetical protein